MRMSAECSQDETHKIVKSSSLQSASGSGLGGTFLALSTTESSAFWTANPSPNRLRTAHAPYPLPPGCAKSAIRAICRCRTLIFSRNDEIGAFALTFQQYGRSYLKEMAVHRLHAVSEWRSVRQSRCPRSQGGTLSGTSSLRSCPTGGGGACRCFSSKRKKTTKRQTKKKKI